MPFLYGNHILKAHLGRITEDTPEHQGVVIFSMNDVPLVNELHLCLIRSNVCLCRDSELLQGRQSTRENWIRQQSLYFIKRMSFKIFASLCFLKDFQGCRRVPP